MPKLRLLTNKASIATFNKSQYNIEDDFYSEVNASALSKISEIVYKDEETIHQYANDCGFNKPIIIERDELRAVIFYDVDHLILAFRGTDNTTNWVTDARIKGEAFPVSENTADETERNNEKVHSGFKQALEILWNDENKSPGIQTHLRNLMLSMKHPIPSIWLTGHSLGAALATLARHKMNIAMQTDILPLVSKESITVYTMGSPRCGNKAFATAYDKLYKQHTFRLVNNHDAVTKLPVYDLVSRMIYKHVGEQRTYYGHELFRNLTRTDKWKRTFNTKILPVLTFKHLRNSLGLADHHMRNYERTLGLRQSSQDLSLALPYLTELELKNQAMSVLSAAYSASADVTSNQPINSVNALIDQRKQDEFRSLGQLLVTPEYRRAVGEEKAHLKQKKWENLSDKLPTIKPEDVHFTWQKEFNKVQFN